MIASHDDRRLQLALLHQIVEGKTELGTLAVTQPADAARQTLKLDPLAGKINPAAQNSIAGKHLQHELVRKVNVGGITGKRRPAERATAFAEERPNVLQHKTWEVVSILHPMLEGKG